MRLLQRMASARTLYFRLAVSALLLWLAAPLAAQEKHLEILGGKLQAELERIVDAYEGVAGVHLVDLTSGDRFGVNDELSVPAGQRDQGPDTAGAFPESRVGAGPAAPPRRHH